LYHSLFYKVVQIIVRENHVESQKSLLNKYKFLSRMIEHYKSPEQTAARGFILLIANTFRLGADLQPPSGWLRHYLVSHDAWKQWLPTLRTDTQTQLKRYSDITADMLDEEEEGFDEDLDIDLGSAYARSLGFEEEAPEQEEAPSTPKRKKKNKKNKKKKKDQPAGNHVGEENKTSPHKETQPVSVLKHEDPEDIQDASVLAELSKEPWWADLKTEFDEDQKKEGGDETDSADWWKDLKEELQTVEGK